MTPEFFKPVKPFVINQPWGTYDPKDYSQFGFTLHNGVDVALGIGAEVRAPYDGKVINVASQPKGGGNYIGFLSDNVYDFPAFTCTTPEGTKIDFPAMSCKVLMDFLHLDHAVLPEGTSAKCGDLLAIADNTGFSTGTHTHIQPRRVSGTDKTNIVHLDTNDANGSFDPSSFWSGIYAIDYLSFEGQVKTLSQRIQDLISKVAQFLQKK